jgi:hypothetical protein
VIHNGPINGFIFSFVHNREIQMAASTVFQTVASDKKNLRSTRDGELTQDKCYRANLWPAFMAATAGSVVSPSNTSMSFAPLAVIIARAPYACSIVRSCRPRPAAGLVPRIYDPVVLLPVIEIIG